MSINKAMLIGNVGKDPDIRILDGGSRVATFTLATTERGYTLTNGTQVPDRTEWHNVVVWGGLVKVVEDYVSKGSSLYIEGKITNRTWEKDGVKHNRTEIITDVLQLLGRKPEAQQQSEQAQQAQPSRATQQPNFATSDGSDGKDDLPF
jgi:single-strand DNA-binding protein